MPGLVRSETEKHLRPPAGRPPRPEETSAIKSISNLVGEVYNKNKDPQDRTDVQRSWLPTSDPCLVRVKSNLGRAPSQINFFDNGTSLPLGEGLQLALRKHS